MLRLILKAFLTIILFMFWHSASAQDSTATGKYDDIAVYYQYENSRDIYIEDTSLTDIHIGDNLGLKMDYLHLRGLTTAASPISYFYNKTAGFDYGMNGLRQNELRNDNIKYFDTKSPFTSLNFSSGTGKQHSFKMVHISKYFCFYSG